MTNMQYQTREEVDMEEMEGKDEILEAREKVKEDKETRLLNIGQAKKVEVFWNENREQVEMSIFKPISTYKFVE